MIGLVCFDCSTGSCVSPHVMMAEYRVMSRASSPLRRKRLLIGERCSAVQWCANQGLLCHNKTRLPPVFVIQQSPGSASGVVYLRALFSRQSLSLPPTSSADKLLIVATDSWLVSTRATIVDLIPVYWLDWIWNCRYLANLLHY